MLCLHYQNERKLPKGSWSHLPKASYPNAESHPNRIWALQIEPGGPAFCEYLSDADFEKYMKSPRSEFNAMKGWKQQQIKKAAGLY